MSEIETFGCGEFLPGYGPFSFPGFVTTFIDSGNGNNITPGIRLDVPQSGRPGTGVPGPGGGGGGDDDNDDGGDTRGPTTPGPAGPAAPKPGTTIPTPTTPGPTGPSAPTIVPKPTITGGYTPTSPNGGGGPGLDPTLFSPTRAGGFEPIPPNPPRGGQSPPTIRGGFNPIPPKPPRGGLDPTIFSPTRTDGFSPIPPRGGEGGLDPTIFSPTIEGGYSPTPSKNSDEPDSEIIIVSGDNLQNSFNNNIPSLDVNEVAVGHPPKTGEYIPPDSSDIFSPIDGFSIKNYLTAGEVVDLSNPDYEKIILTRIDNLLDKEISLDMSYFTTRLVKNTSKYTTYFSNAIDIHINYLLTNIGYENKDWTHVSIFGLTKQSLLASLKPEILEKLRKVKNYDDTYLSDTQIYSIFANRILDHTLDNNFLSDILSLENIKRNNPIVKRSSNNKINELFVLSDLPNTMVSLDPTNHNNELTKLLPNWKVLSTDIDKFIPIQYGDQILKYYVKDDETFVDRESLSIKDGDYFSIYYNGSTTKLYCVSEIDHAYLLNEYDKQRYINVLGGKGSRTLSVSSLVSDGIEFSYSLDTPRQNYYLLSCILSSLETLPSNPESDFLKTTSLEYGLIDTTTEEGITAANEYIKYKANYRTIIVEDDDRILDYIEETGKIKITQEDIILTSVKEAKELPLLTRQIPWYIIIYPTNRSDYSIFADKSQITIYDPTGIVERKLECSPTISKTFNIDDKEFFIKYSNAYLESEKNVFGETDLQGRISQLNPSSSIYKTGYKDSNNVIKSAENFTPNRKKTGFRIIKEVINELDTNYLLGLNGIGKSVTIFDVVSRLSLSQYANFTKKENFSTLFKLIKNGLFNDVKLIAPVKNSNDNLGKYKTQLIRKKAAAAEDTFTPIKLTADQYYISPPTTTEPPSRTR